MGLRVTLALLRLGEKVTVLAVQPDPELLEMATGAGATVVEGKTTELSHLRAAGVERARCLVLTEDADLGNLNAALGARELNPHVRVVLRMFNVELARRATGLLPNSRVISASLEAAPHLAAAALGIPTGPSRMVWGRHLEITLSPDDALVELANGYHLRAHEGPAPARRRRRRHRRLRELRAALRAFFDRRLAAIGTAIALLVSVAVVIFHSFDHLGWVDSLYFTVTTASTTGYGDFNLMNASPWLKIFDVGFMLAAAVSVALLFALAADAIVGVRILQALGVPRGNLRGHVVVVGLGNAGYRLVDHLDQLGVECAAAEISERSRFVRLARQQGIPVLTGDGRLSDSLHALSVEGARAVCAVTNYDLVNLEVVLAARELNPGARLVARLFDPSLASRAQKQLGIDACYSVSALATPAFVAAALGEDVITTLEHDGDLWLLAQLMVEPGSRLDGMSLRELELADAVRVLAVRDGQQERWTPTHTTRVEAGHEVLLACSLEGWEKTRMLAGAAG
jgi:Trk K+ transport system NAD-binding subunit